jgi:hypothetical protein
LSLLREIQDLATTDGDLANLLRKCKILAARLGSEQFSGWVDYELDDYPEGQIPSFQPRPRYRKSDI